MHTLKIFLVLFIFTVICYSNVINGPLLFDDEHFIEKNITIHSLNNIRKIYTSSVTGGAGIKGNFYRPNQQLIYAVIYHFFKLRSSAYHTVSVAVHFLNSFFIFLLLTKLSFTVTESFIVSFIFLIHPVQTESVSYISGLAGPLGFCFILVSLIFFTGGVILKNNKRILYFALSVLVYIAALFSKENMVIFLPLTVIIYFFIHINFNFKKIDRSVIITAIIIFFVTAGYLYLKFSVFKFTQSAGLTNQENVYTENIHVRLITFINILWDYAKLITVPINLFYEKPYTAYVEVLTLRALFGFLLIVCLIYSLIYVKRYKKIFLGFAWFFTALIPYTGIIPLNAMFLEHWLYIPLVGVLIVLSNFYIILKNIKKEKYLLIILIPLCLFYMTRTIMRNSEWTDIEKFYLNELKYTNSSIRIYNNLGMYYSDRGNADKAIDYYRKAIALRDTYPQPHHNLANIYLDRGDYKNTLKELYCALKINPDFIYSLNKLYQVYIKLNRRDKASKIAVLVRQYQAGKKNSFKDIERIMFSP